MSSDSLLTSARGDGVPSPRPAPSRSSTVRPGASAVPGRDPVVRRVLDGAPDAAVISFALWTLLYCLGLATQWRLWASGWVWLVLTVGLVGWQVVAAVRGAPR